MQVSISTHPVFKPFNTVSRSMVRDVLFPLATFLFVFLVPISWYIAGFLILGQAHFAISALYRWRTGRGRTRYLVLTFGFFVASVAYFVLGGGYVPIFLVATFFFGVHFAFDEFFLHGESMDFGKQVSAWVFIILFFAMIVYTSLPSERLLAFAVGLVFPSYILARLLLRRGPTRAERYLWLVGAIIFTLTFAFSVRAEILLAVISILHQTNWYVDYGRKIADRGDAVRVKKYWYEIAISLLISSALYFLFAFGVVHSLQYLYLPVFYYAWAIAHFGLSVRKRTVRT